MAVNNKAVVQWFYDRQGKLTYSMQGSRNGTDGTADCSGSITQAIRDAGGVPYAYLYSTVTLASYLKANGYTRISANQSWDAQMGDIVLMSWGADMSSSGGAGGHVGVMEDAVNFISVDYWTGGQAGTAVSRHVYNNYHAVNAPRYIEVWRLVGGGGGSTSTPSQGTNGFKYGLGQVVNFGGVFHSSAQASTANPNNGYTPASKLTKSSGVITSQLKTNGVETYLIDNGFGWINNGDISTSKAPTSNTSNDVDYMAQHGEVIWNGKVFRVDDRSSYAGLLQVVSRELSGIGNQPITDTIRHNNGVPMSGISWADGTPNSSTQGTTFRFDQDRMSIVGYDKPTNGICINVAGYDVWVDATVARKA